MQFVTKWLSLIIVAAIFSMLQLVSTYIFNYVSFQYAPNSAKFFNIFLLITFFVLYLAAGGVVYWIIEQCAYQECTSDTQNKSGWQYFVVIILGWSPWLYAFYPGTVFYDMGYEYEQYYGSASLSLHPPFPTYIMGLLMDVGKTLFKSDNIGCFLYILLQTVVCAAACAKALTILEKLKINKKIIILLLLFYALFPDFGASAQFGTKDVLNYGLILLAGTYIYQIYRQISEKTALFNIFLSCAGYINCAFISCLIRKEMMYIYVFIGAVLIVYCLIGKCRKICAVLLYGIVLLSLSSVFSEKILAEKIMGQTFNAGESEGLSLPLMQVARFVYYHGDWVTDEEKDILTKCFSLSFSDISKNYNPNLSDSIKRNFRVREAKQAGFYKVYWSFFKKDPFLFLESLVAGSYGYYSILPNAQATINNAPTNWLPGRRLPLFLVDQSPGETFGNVSGIHYSGKTGKLRMLLSDWLYGIERSFNVIFGFGFCTFLLVTLCLCFIQKSRKITGIIPFILPIMLCLVCIASPVNDYGRYYMGIFYLMPFILGITIKSASCSNQKVIKGQLCVQLHCHPRS